MQPSERNVALPQEVPMTLLRLGDAQNQGAAVVDRARYGASERDKHQ